MVKKIFKFKQGAVSIFVVIFTSLLIGLIALAFIRLMILGQKRALNSDLADSAYDSALAGLEDAKRAIIEYERNICANDATKCRELANNVLNGNNCDAIQHILGGDRGKEVPIAKKGGSNALDQAYTCVKIKYFTDSDPSTVQKIINNFTRTEESFKIFEMILKRIDTVIYKDGKPEIEKYIENIDNAFKPDVGGHQLNFKANFSNIKVFLEP